VGHIGRDLDCGDLDGAVGHVGIVTDRDAKVKREERIFFYSLLPLRFT
jgi:hypothetical protein